MMNAMFRRLAAVVASLILIAAVTVVMIPAARAETVYGVEEFQPDDPSGTSDNTRPDLPQIKPFVIPGEEYT